MSANNEGWNFGEGDFPSIEIDVEYFKTLSKMERLKYIGKLFFQEKDLGNRINMLNYVTGTVAKVGKVFIKNTEFKEYLNLVENGTKLIGVSAALGNMFKAKQTYKHTKNNEIAKLMGFPNGNYVNFTKMEVTQAMLEAFLEMSELHKEKYGIKIENTVSEGEKEDPTKKAEKDGTVVGMKKMMVTGSIDGKDENKWGLVVNLMVGVFDDDETTNVSNAKLFYPITGTTIHHEDLKERIQKIMFELYIDKVDTRRNYVRVNGTKLEICERHNITENIRNIDIPKIKKSIEKTLAEGSRRGIVFVGEPGVGKTIAVHKLINHFPNNLIFWVNPDSISTVMGIRNVFKIFEMFKNSIMVFDDIDSAPLTRKDEITNEFLVKLDGTSNLTGFVIATVNDPSKLHSALINRPERFDEAIEVKTPQSVEEVVEIIFSKSHELGYVTKDEKDNEYYGDGEIKGLITIFPEKKIVKSKSVKGKGKPKAKSAKTLKSGDEPLEVSAELAKLCDVIIGNKLTQVQVAGLVRYCHQYFSEVSIESLEDALKSTLNSISCANKIAKKGRLIDSEDLSDESKSNLNARR